MDDRGGGQPVDHGPDLDDGIHRAGSLEPQTYGREHTGEPGSEHLSGPEVVPGEADGDLPVQPSKFAFRARPSLPGRKPLERPGSPRILPIRAVWRANALDLREFMDSLPRNGV